jgi:hypothetical protein
MLEKKMTEEIDESKFFIKFEKIKHLGIEGNEEIFHTSELVVVQTKLDGANSNFWVDGDGLHFGRHKAELTKEEIVGKRKDGKYNWAFVEYIENAYEKHGTLINPDWRYFGESMNGHVVQYTDVPGFVGYDILDTTTGKFLPWGKARDEFILLGLPFVHVCYEVPGNELVLEDLKKLYKTSVYGAKEDEGIVLKCDALENRYGRALRTKIVNPKFKEDKGKRKNREPIDNKDEVEITERYATEARILKKILEFKDIGEKIDLDLMRKLPSIVAEDILEENIVTIYKEQKKVHFKTLRNYVGKRCIKVLKAHLESKILL